MPQQQLNWQPISTFPKDGKPYLCYHPHHNRHGYQISSAWYKEAINEIGGHGWEFASFDLPTHWCEIPNLPQDEDLQQPEKPRLIVILGYNKPYTVATQMRALGYPAPAGMPPHPRNGWIFASSDERLHGLKDVDFYIHSSFHNAPAWVSNPMMQTVRMLMATGNARLLEEIPKNPSPQQ